MTNTSPKFDSEELAEIDAKAVRYAKESSNKFLKSQQIAQDLGLSQRKVSRAMEVGTEFEEWTSGNGSINRVFLNPFYKETQE
jgi:hypothetical protein